jgi:hypothetical protein
MLKRHLRVIGWATILKENFYSEFVFEKYKYLPNIGR